MTNFSFQDNKEFIINSVARPVVIDGNDPNIKIDLQPDLALFIESPTKIIKVKDKVVKSSIMPTIGLTGLLLKGLLEENAALSDSLLDLITPILKDNLSHFLFFLDSDDSDPEAIIVRPLFTRSLDPDLVPINQQERDNYICTTHLPITEGNDYIVSDFDQDPNMKVFTINLSRTDDVEKDFYPIIHNKASVSWNDKWDQRAYIHARRYGINMVLPRNYGKVEYKVVDDIMNHIDYLISKLDINADYDAEFNEMLSAKLPNKGTKFMMDTEFKDHALKSILSKISDMLEDMKPSEIKAVSQCLGFMVAKKIHCCSECRHMDEETL